MKEYNLIKGNKQNELTLVDWDDFLNEIKKKGKREIMLFIISEEMNDVELAKKFIISQVKAKDGYEVWADYNIQNKKTGDIYPCIAFVDTNVKKAVVEAHVFYQNSFFIQCIHFDYGRSAVNKVDLVHYDGALMNPN